MSSSTPQAATGGLARAYAAVVVGLRYVIVAGWIAAVVAAVSSLPVLTQSDGVAGLVPASSPAVQAEYTATRLFGEPLDAQAVVVQRAPRGLPPSAVRAAVSNAVSTDTGHATGTPISGLAGALPIPNTDGLFPGSRERSTTVLTYLYFRPSASTAAQLAGSELYASRYASAPADHLVGVTGAAPATYEQGVVISQHLVWVEIATDPGDCPDRRLLLPGARCTAGDAGLRRDRIFAGGQDRRLGDAADACHPAA